MDAYETNKEFILENIDLESLFDYLVKHKHMHVSIREKLLNNWPLSSWSRTEYRRKIYNDHFCTGFLNNVIKGNTYDNLINKSLCIIGQKDVVLKYFPDFIEKSRTLTLNRIDHIIHHNMFDANKIIKYMKDNALYAPDQNMQKKTHTMQTRQDNKSLNGKRDRIIPITKTHTMQTRQDKKSLHDKRNDELLIVKSILKSRVQRDDFDFHTDSYFKSFDETGQTHILDFIFPERTIHLLWNKTLTV